MLAGWIINGDMGKLRRTDFIKRTISIPSVYYPESTLAHSFIKCTKLTTKSDKRIHTLSQPVLVCVTYR